MVQPMNFCVKGLRCENGLIHCICFYTLSQPSLLKELALYEHEEYLWPPSDTAWRKKKKRKKKKKKHLEPQLRNSVKHFIMISLNFCMCA